MGIFSMVMLETSKGEDLDRLGILYWVERHENENDDIYRKRIIDACKFKK